eukprot:Awhi_evm1s4506
MTKLPTTHSLPNLKKFSLSNNSLTQFSSSKMKEKILSTSSSSLSSFRDIVQLTDAFRNDLLSNEPSTSTGSGTTQNPQPANTIAKSKETIFYHICTSVFVTGSNSIDQDHQSGGDGRVAHYKTWLRTNDFYDLRKKILFLCLPEFIELPSLPKKYLIYTPQQKSISFLGNSLSEINFE